MRTYRHTGDLLVNGERKKSEDNKIHLTDEEVKSLPFQLGFKLLTENWCEIISLADGEVLYRMKDDSEDLLFLLKSVYSGYSDFKKVE